MKQITSLHSTNLYIYSVSTKSTIVFVLQRSCLTFIFKNYQYYFWKFFYVLGVFLMFFF